MKSKNVSTRLHIDNIIEGECDIPELLIEFVTNLIKGPDAMRKKSDEEVTKIKSLCSDIIYIITKGRIRPSKHLALGLAVKSLTSSRKILTMLNRYGHTINYTLAEELETELTYSSIQETKLIPSSISREGNLATNIAYDKLRPFC